MILIIVFCLHCEFSKKDWIVTIDVHFPYTLYLLKKNLIFFSMLSPWNINVKRKNEKKYQKKTLKHLQTIKSRPTFASLNETISLFIRRGAGVVTEQIANLSSGNRCQGSSPCLSANKDNRSGCSVARLSRLLWEQEVAGSNPATPTNQTFIVWVRSNSSAG